MFCHVEIYFLHTFSIFLDLYQGLFTQYRARNIKCNLYNDLSNIVFVSLAVVNAGMCVAITCAHSFYGCLQLLVVDKLLKVDDSFRGSWDLDSGASSRP